MFEVAYTQHRGKRNPHQQDALWDGTQAIQSINTPSVTKTVMDASLLLAIADGVAISPFPGTASLFVIKTLGATVDVKEPLTPRLVRRIHGLLCDRYAKGRTRGSSTTLVAAHCTDDRCEIVNVGDSRAYRIAADGQWQQLSHDHTVINGLIAKGEAEVGQEYASCYDALEYCLIADDEEDRFAVHACQLTYLQGDSLLLCSDGLHDTLGDAGLQRLYHASATPLEQVAIWHKAVMAAGAPDNFSIILSRRVLG